MEIVDDRAAAQIEEVLAQPTITGASALPIGHMRQGMLDGDPLAQFGPSRRRQLAGAQLAQERLVRMDVYTAAVRAGRTLGTQWTSGAGRRREMHRAAQGKGHLDLVRTAQALPRPVQREGGLGKAPTPITHRPGFAI